jgi:hypothetical protein
VTDVDVWVRDCPLLKIIPAQCFHVSFLDILQMERFVGTCGKRGKLQLGHGDFQDRVPGIED